MILPVSLSIAGLNSHYFLYILAEAEILVLICLRDSRYVVSDGVYALKDAEGRGGEEVLPQHVVGVLLMDVVSRVLFTPRTILMLTFLVCLCSLV